MNDLQTYSPTLRTVDASSYYWRFGGYALGLKLAEELAEDIPQTATPRYVVELESLFSMTTTMFHEALARVWGSSVVCKLSGRHEAFAPTNARGANSSLFNPRFIVNNDLTPDEVSKWIKRSSWREYVAVVFQTLACTTNGLSFLVHADDNTVAVETTLDEKRYVFVKSSSQPSYHAESTLPDRSTKPVESRVDIRAFFDLQSRIFNRCGFPVNTEGFYESGTYTILQLRPIPQDTFIDAQIREAIDRVDVRSYSDATLTYLSWGRFDVEGTVVAEGNFPDPFTPEPLIVARSAASEHPDPDQLDVNDRPREVIERLETIEWLRDRGLLSPLHYQQTRLSILRPRPWDHPVIRERLLRGLPTVVINFSDGFHLNHKPELLPPPGALRDRYCCVTLPWLSCELLVAKRVRVLGDGQRALFCLGDPPHRDRRRTVMIKGRQVNFVALGSSFTPPLEKITSVGIVPFLSDGKLVVVQLSRGVDLPGGHVQQGEQSIEETARREAMEEARITLRGIRTVQVVQSDYYGTAHENLTYLVIVTAYVDQLLEFVPTAESTARLVVTPDEFLARYSAGDTEQMRQLISEAQEILFEDRTSSQNSTAP